MKRLIDKVGFSEDHDPEDVKDLWNTILTFPGFVGVSIYRKNDPFYPFTGVFGANFE